MIHGYIQGYIHGLSMDDPWIIHGYTLGGFILIIPINILHISDSIGGLKAHKLKNHDFGEFSALEKFRNAF